MPPMLKRQVSSLNNNKIYIVCLDGSRMSLRGLRLTAFVMQPTDKVRIITVATGADGKTPEQILSDGELYLTTSCKVRPRQVAKEIIHLEAGQQLGDAIVKVGNFTPGGSGIIVMGSAGRGGEDAAVSSGNRPKGQQPMGSIAASVMHQSKVPGESACDCRSYYNAASQP